MIALGWMNIGAAVAPDAVWLPSFLPFWLSQVIRALVQYCTGNPSGRCGPGTDHHRSYITVAFQHAADKAADNGNLTGFPGSTFLLCSCKQCVWLFRRHRCAVCWYQRSTEHAERDSEVVTNGLNIAGGMIVVVGYGWLST